MATKNSTKVETNGKLGTGKVRVLEALKKGKAMTRPEVAAAVAKTGVTLYSNRIGNESKTYAELEADGLVASKVLGGDGEIAKETRYTLTTAGKKALANAK